MGWAGYVRNNICVVMRSWLMTCVCGDQLSHCDMVVVVVVHDFQTVVFLPTPSHLLLLLLLFFVARCVVQKRKKHYYSYDKRKCVPDEKHPTTLVSLC